MTNTRLFTGAALLIVVLGAVQFYVMRAHTDSFSSTTESATSTEHSEVALQLPQKTDPVIASVAVKSTQSAPAQSFFSIASDDQITSWNFKGAYTDNPVLVQQAKEEIVRLSGTLGTTTSSTMTILVGIANQYELLGDGKKQYEYLNRAIQADPGNGLPWHNLGVLMERLSALSSARIAYDKSTELQPQFSIYHFAYLEFLIAKMPNDSKDIENAFSWAEKNIGKAPYLADLRSAWKGS